MKKNLFLIIAILCAVTQGAWAQTPSGEGWGEASTFNFQLPQCLAKLIWA